MADSTLTDVLTAFRTATDACRQWAKGWHHWALFNAAAMEHYAKVQPAAAPRHVAPAISGFFRSIALGGTAPQKGKGGLLQDILRLLTLWFNHGAAPEVEAALLEGFGHVSIDTWLAVIPQIVARIHSNSTPVRSLIHHLLVRIGRQHPQALLYPLLVACKSQSTSRRSAAMMVLEDLRQHSALLVEQAQVVSLELIRVAILWHEAWHEALEEASQLYFGEQNVDGMLRVLAPLHHIIERQGAETLHEISFVQVRSQPSPPGSLKPGENTMHVASQSHENSKKTNERRETRTFVTSEFLTCMYLYSLPFESRRRTAASSRKPTTGARSTARRAARRS